MKKMNGLLSGFLISALLLAGCGTAELQEKADEKRKTEDQAKPEKGMNPGGSPSSEGDSGESMRIMEQNLKFQVNGSEKQETAFLQTSDNQQYSLYVLPDYILTAEEPGKDIMSLKDRENINMRIEIQKPQTDWSSVEDNMKKQLEAVSPDIKSVEPSVYSIENGTVFETFSGDETVTSVLIKDTDLPVRLTIFTTKQDDYRDAFIQMARTILKN